MTIRALVATCLLAAGLVVPATAVPAAAGEEPYRYYDFSVPTTVEQGDAAAAEVEVFTTHDTSVRVQIRYGADPWIDAGPALPVAHNADWDDDPFTARVPIPTDTIGTYLVRLVLDAGPDFPEAETSWTETVKVVLAPPTATIPSTVTMSALSRSRPDFGEHVTISGSATGPGSRQVTLSLATPNGWTPLATTTTGAAGSYRMIVPTDWYYSGRIRVSVAQTRVGDVLHDAATSDGARVRVPVPYQPRGNASDWTSLAAGNQRQISRWDPCQTIAYKVNTAGAPRGALGMTKKALGIVSAATGLRFDYRGRTRGIPFRTTRGPEHAAGADLTIAWASPRHVPGLGGNTIGLGGHGSHFMGRGEDARAFYGGVALDRTWRRGRPGFKRGATWGSLLLHEIGHAVGLSHARGRDQVMHSGLHDGSPGWYEAGDLAGLRRVGASQGCFELDRASRSATGTPTVVVME
jgi:hypothetical protein